MDVVQNVIRLVFTIIPPLLCLGGIVGLLLPTPLALRLIRNGMNRRGARGLGLGLLVLTWLLTGWLLIPRVGGEFGGLVLFYAVGLFLLQLLLFVLATWPPAARPAALPAQPPDS